ncbi:WXG100 family type VII secretion target [Mycolicibacterium sp. CBMA 226]|uniref:WXG100 family type VII secretion target n=1 Tax=Mycolicibacterium sp. CBMA 226 TaxID=2606611 RepID=UPI0012DBE8CA|nr:hypothetical protein [Mycolicibacterium sp. CBMA 226]MUL77855.1 hypothetical protein [Mycolicibacterium sp. CBMA 226]
MVEMPTRTKVESWKSDHLASAADAWTRQVHTVEDIYGRAQQAVAEPTWHGSAADSAHDRMFSDIVRVRTAMEMLRKAASIAKNGADLLAGLKRSAVEAISNAERQFFSVSDNLRVTDRIPKVLVGPLLLVRDLARAALEADIRGKALSLAAADEQIASQLKPIATSLREFKTDQPGGGDPTHDGKGPTIIGPAGPLTPERDDADLYVTIPGTGIMISGDGRNGYPTLNGKKNPLIVPDGYRPLPTGAAAGPDGTQYAGYSILKYHAKDKNGREVFATPDTTIVNLADPSKPIGTLKGISQASFAYDEKNDRMIIIGNTSDDPTNRTRKIWFAPVDKNNPNGWVNSVDANHPYGDLGALPGNRETQIVPMKGGGFMVVGADNVDDKHPTPASAVTVSAAEELKNPGLNATPLIPRENWPSNPDPRFPAPPYGPTVTGTTYDPVTGQEVVQMRVSAWKAGPPDYNPYTYTTSVSVQH